MKRQDGTPTNGIHGYMKHLLTATQAIEPTHIVTCWDMGSTTFRTESFSNYKANRAAPPEELIPQFDLVQEMTAKLSIPVIGMKGYEADDCIGTLAKQYCNEAEVYILTGDTDLLQLVDKNVTVMLLRKGIEITNITHRRESWKKRCRAVANRPCKKLSWEIQVIIIQV